MTPLDYQPLLPGLTLYYAWIGYDALEPEVGRLVWKVEEVHEQGGVKTARVSTRRDEKPPQSHELRLDAQGLWSGRTLELKLPPVLDESWTAEDDAYPLRRVLSLEARAATAAKEFEGCLEIGLTNEDTDSGGRWYYPGLGLVLERWSGESRNTALSLIHWSLPRH